MIHQLLQEMISYFGNDQKRISHSLKVFGYAEAIADAENLIDFKREIVQVSAVLHDIGIHEAERKYHSAAGHLQEKEGPPIARQILMKFGLSEEFIDRVCDLIGHHHHLQDVDDIDFQILIEADLIVNIEEENWGRQKVEKLVPYFKTDAGKKIMQQYYPDLFF